MYNKKVDSYIRALENNKLDEYYKNKEKRKKYVKKKSRCKDK